MGQQHLTVLGRWRLLDVDGGELRLRRKEQALLSYLCLEPHRHDRASLARLLWPDLDASKGRNNLRLALHKVRKACGDPGWLDTGRNHVEIDGDGGLRTDVRDLLDGTLDPDDVAPLSLPPLDDCPAWTEWVTAWEETVARAATNHLESTARRRLSTDPEIAETVARRLVALDPLVETGHEVLCLALLAQDRDDDARAVLHTCRTVLDDELGVTPGPGIVALEERLGSHVPATTTPTVDPGEPLSTSPLPVPTSTFVGRTTELAAFADLLHERDHRLLSIVAAGGMGKSRLSLEVARANGGRFDEGAVFVRLDGLRDPDDIPGAIAAALGLPSVPAAADPAATLRCELAEREVLLVVDNLEHLLDGGAEFVADLVASCPHVVVLATSRQPLLVSAEDVHDLGGLDLPAPDDDLDALRTADAVRLFIDRAHRIDKDLRVDGDTADDIRRICTATEGMPLAIELAASALRDLPLADVATTVEETPDELQTDLRDVEPRHRAIADVHAQSLARLSDEDRAALLALSVFRGGCTGDAATFVARCDRVTLVRLCRASLLDRGYDDRFRMHELHRALSARRLAKDPAVEAEVRHRHAVHHLRRLATSAPAMSRVGAPQVVRALREDIDNLRAAWATAVRLRDTSLLVAASAGLVALGRSAGLHAEAAEMLADAVEVADDPDARSLLRLRQIRVSAVEGSAPVIRELRDALLASLGDSPANHRVLAGLHLSWAGVAARDLDDIPDAAHHLALATAAAAHVDDPVLHAYVELEHAEGAIERLELDVAERRAIAARDMLADEEHVRGQARANMVLANCLLDQNRLWEARGVLITSIAQGHEIGDLAHVANTSSNLGYALLLLGDHEAGERRTLDAIDAFRRQGLRDSLYHEYAQLGELQLRQGRTDEGEACFLRGLDGMRSQSHDHLLRYQLARWCRWLLTNGRALEAELTAQDLLDHVGRIDAPQFVATAEAMLAHALLLSGRVDDALPLATSAWESAATLPWPAGTAMDCHHVFAAAGDRARTDASRRRAEEVVRTVAATIPDPGARAMYLRHSPAAADLAHRPENLAA